MGCDDKNDDDERLMNIKHIAHLKRISKSHIDKTFERDIIDIWGTDKSDVSVSEVDKSKIERRYDF